MVEWVSTDALGHGAPVVEWVSVSVFVWIYVISRVPMNILPFAPRFQLMVASVVEVLSLFARLTKRYMGVFLTQRLFMVKGKHE